MFCRRTSRHLLGVGSRLVPAFEPSAQAAGACAAASAAAPWPRRPAASVAVPREGPAGRQQPLQADPSSVLLVAGLGLAGAAFYLFAAGDLPDVTEEPPKSVPVEKQVALMNWSGTHAVTVQRVFSPETQQQLQELVAWAARTRSKIRPVGTCLSPNGLALQQDGMLSLAQLDRILNVDTRHMTVTVEAGARVSQVLEELRKYGLTLENFSSITEQQIGGWTQVAAHGTGARLSTVDDMITYMTLVTPSRGVLRLSKDGPNSDLFHWARVGLGSLGVVSKVTLKCIPQFTLHEKTYCTTVDKLEREHADLLQNYRHVRYMWIPYTDTVVVVVSDKAKPGVQVKEPLPESERVKPLQDLLREIQPQSPAVQSENFATLRESLLAIDPLNANHVARVNRAEAEFWRLSSGERIGDSTDILGFECGGSQWVLENCIPAGRLNKPSLEDIEYVKGMLQLIEREKIPAASPIEQRWTARSTSPLSPAYSKQADAIFSWVGIIMYITDEAHSPAIKEKFREYSLHHLNQTMEHQGTFHWGKIDLDFLQGKELDKFRASLRKRFDVAPLQQYRRELDPHNLLGNNIVDGLTAERRWSEQRALETEEGP